MYCILKCILLCISKTFDIRKVSYVFRESAGARWLPDSEWFSFAERKWEFSAPCQHFSEAQQKRPRRRKRGKYNVKSTSIFPRVFFHTGIEPFDFLILCSDLTPNHSTAFVPPVLFSSRFWKKLTNIIRGNRSKKKMVWGKLFARKEKRREKLRDPPSYNTTMEIDPPIPPEKPKMNEWSLKPFGLKRSGLAPHEIDVRWKFKSTWRLRGSTCPGERCRGRK